MTKETKFVICVNNQDYPASLERWKIYRAIADEKAENRNLIRIVDESGEDYLYSVTDFVAINLPREVRIAFLSLAT